MRSRQLIWRIPLSVAILAAAAVLAVVLVHRAEQVPWDRMERAVNSVPVPEGFSAGHVSRVGRRCVLSPSCQSPRVSLSLTAAPGQVARCSDLDAIVSEWKPEHRFTKVHAEQILGGGCGYDGQVDGLPAGFQLIDDEIIVSVGT